AARFASLAIVDEGDGLDGPMPGEQLAYRVFVGREGKVSHVELGHFRVPTAMFDRQRLLSSGSRTLGGDGRWPGVRLRTREAGTCKTKNHKPCAKVPDITRIRRKIGAPPGIRSAGRLAEGVREGAAAQRRTISTSRYSAST